MLITTDAASAASWVLLLLLLRLLSFVVRPHGFCFGCFLCSIDFGLRDNFRPHVHFFATRVQTHPTIEADSAAAAIHSLIPVLLAAAIHSCDRGLALALICALTLALHCPLEPK